MACDPPVSGLRSGLEVLGEPVRAALPAIRSRGGVDVGVGRGNLVHDPAAPAPAGHAHAVRACAGPLLGPVDRGGDVAEELLARHGEDNLEDVLDVRELADAAFALEELGSDGV